MNIPDEMNCWIQFPSMVGYAACYEALAEECMDLAHCALKLARVLRGDNPVGGNGAGYLDKLKEEYTDVVSCAIALGLKPNADISVWKWERHKKRMEEIMELEIKPCPFCGGKAKIMRKGTRSGRIRSYSVDCPECLANGPVFWVADWHRTPFIAQGKAVRAWNNRVEVIEEVCDGV